MMAPIYTQGYSKDTASLDGGKDHPNSHLRFITLPNSKAEKCLSNSCLTFCLSGMNKPDTFMLALALGENWSKRDSKVTKQMIYCGFMNAFLFHVCSVSTTMSLTDAQRLYFIFPSAKCSVQPIAGAKQMFTSRIVKALISLF